MRFIWYSLALASIVLMPTVVFAANLSISQQPGVICEGGTYTLDILLDSPTEAINTIQLELDWDPTRMSMVKTDFTGSLFYFWPFSDVDNVTGYAKSIGGIMTPGFQGTDGLVYHPVIRVLGTGSVTLTILPTTDVLLNDGAGSSASVTFENLTLSVLPIGDPACATPTPVPATPGPTGIPGPTPTPFECPETRSCSLPEEGTVYPCQFIQTCPGYPDTTLEGFVTNPDVQCPIQYACVGGIPVVPPTEPLLPDIIQTTIDRWLPGPAGESVLRLLYIVRPAVNTFTILTVIGAVAALLGAIYHLYSVLGGLSELISMGWYGLAGLSRLKPRRNRIWGTVFDSYTKKPLPMAHVEMLSADGRVLQRCVSGIDGTYGFLSPMGAVKQELGQIQLRASKDGYRFPSSMTTGNQEDLYKNVYRSGVISIDERHLIGHDIPMDPIVTPDLNPRLQVRAAIAAWIASLADASFKVSTVMAPINYLMKPNLLNGVMVGVVIGTAILRQIGFKIRPFGAIADSTSGLAVPYAVVTLHDHAGQRLGHSVSDEHGRFFIRSRDGAHQLNVKTHPQAATQRSTTTVVQPSKGWVRAKVTL